MKLLGEIVWDLEFCSISIMMAHSVITLFHLGMQSDNCKRTSLITSKRVALMGVISHKGITAPQLVRRSGDVSSSKALQRPQEHCNNIAKATDAHHNLLHVNQIVSCLVPAQFFCEVLIEQLHKPRTSLSLVHLWCGLTLTIVFISLETQVVRQRQAVAYNSRSNKILKQMCIH